MALLVFIQRYNITMNDDDCITCFQNQQNILEYNE